MERPPGPVDVALVPTLRARALFHDHEPFAQRGHLWLTDQIIDRASRLDDGVLDRPVELSVGGIDDNPSLRGLADRLVGQLEMWVTALEGGTSMPQPGDTTPDGLHARLAEAGPRFRELVVEPVEDGRAGDPMRFVGGAGDDASTITRRRDG